MEFEELSILHNHNHRPRKRTKNKVEDGRWVGKIWIALSVVMMILGIHLNGLGGSEEKSVRVSEMETKTWVQDFEDPEAEGLTIKMKTKTPTVFINNKKEVGGSSHSKWRDKWEVEGQSNSRKSNAK
jgi:hypothetical protein